MHVLHIMFQTSRIVQVLELNTYFTALVDNNHRFKTHEKKMGTQFEIYLTM
jgi:hypothetical protein